MIHVTRGPAPAFLDEEKMRLQAEEPGQAWTRLDRSIRQKLHSTLVRVFKNKCAYCEGKFEHSIFVVDHFKPLHKYPELALDWNNLYLCCPVCDAHKRNIDPVDPATGKPWLLDPCAADEDPEELLQFARNGVVAPRPDLPESERLRGDRTIAALGLNRNDLVEQRHARIAGITLIHKAVEASPYDAKWQTMEAEYIAADTPYAGAARDTLRRLKSTSKTEESDATLPRPAAPTKHLIKTITLQNIGPFGNLELSLTPGWNLLLGDNGCGKSTLLRAIALALAGTDNKAALAAPRLLRADSEFGLIRLTTDHNDYRTTLARVRGEVDRTVEDLTLVAEGQWLALGFPAVRGYSARPMLGPSATTPPAAGAHDLLPLLEDSADPRMDDTRQWLVNTILRAEGNESEEIRSRFQRRAEWWFRILHELMPGLTLEFERLDRDSWQVLVRSADGIIPMEQLSLGMLSTIGWIGTLLRRLAEAYPDSEHPEKEPALVLIDEIDAHLHPQWQKRLVPLMKEWFPNLQVIAASHSPLIASHLRREEIIVLSRDASGRLQAASIDEPLTGLRADQVLTSAAFGLKTTRSTEADALIQDLQTAVSEDDGTPSATARIAELRARVRKEIALPPETADERKQMANELRAADEAIRERLRQATPTELDEVKKLLAAHRAKREAP